MEKLLSQLGSGSLMSLILKVGVWPVLAGYLVWLMTGVMREEIHQISVEMQTQGIVLEKLQVAVQQETVQNQLLIDLQRQQCINMADDYLKRAACWNPLRGQ